MCDVRALCRKMKQSKQHKAKQQNNTTMRELNYCYTICFTRDSHIFDVANFIAFARRLNSIEPKSEKGWLVVRFGHLKHGYVYSILIHKDSPLLRVAESSARELKEYPILDKQIFEECAKMIKKGLEQDGVSDKMQIYETNAVRYCMPLLEPYL